MTTTKRDNIIKAFGVAGAVVGGIVGVAVTVAYSPSALLPISSAAGAVSGLFVGAVAGEDNGGGLRGGAKGALIGAAAGATGFAGLLGASAAAVTAVAGAAVGYPVQVVADWRKNNQARSNLTPT